MKYSFRTIISILALMIGITGFSVWLLFRHYESKQLSEIQQKFEVLVPPIKGKVEFYFLECAGRRLVFILENQTDHSIYARVRRKDFWKEFKDANLEYGIHYIEYKAPDGEKFEDISGRWDSVDPFKEIMPNLKVRYGIDLPQGKGDYILKIPYLDNAEIAERFDYDFVTKNIQAVEHNITFWKEVETNVIKNPCH